MPLKAHDWLKKNIPSLVHISTGIIHIHNPRPKHLWLDPDPSQIFLYKYLNTGMPL